MSDIFSRVLKILKEEGLTGLGLRINDYREFRKARQSGEGRSLAEALLADLSGLRKQNTKEKQNIVTIKLNHFLSQNRITLNFPETAQPIVSIILSISSRTDLTYECLESILAYTALPYELILIKAPDEDETSNSLIRKLKNVKTVTPEQQRGFYQGCNRGARLSSGEFLVFLSGDARVTPAWAPLLVEGMAGNPAWGAVGVKLVHPHGKLLEAGNILWRDGTYRRYGGGDNPYKPEYSYVRQVDFCSPACFLVRRSLFRTLGGFDPMFDSAFYGAADLGLRLFQQGGRVMYYPLVTIYHQGSARHGASLPEKTIRETDRLKFTEKWAGYLARQGTPPTTPIPTARDLRPGLRILFIEDRIPAPPQGCGFPRSFKIVQYLAELGHIITVLPTLNPTPWQPFTQALERLGVETVYGRTGDWRRFFKQRENGYEIVWVSRHHNLAKFFGMLKTFLPEAAIIFDSEALFSLRELEKIKVKQPPHPRVREIQVRERLREEFQRMKRADLVVTVSEREKKIMALEGIQNIWVWPHAVTIHTPETPFHDRKDLLFVGGFLARESPNTAAIVYFVEKVFPTLKKKLGVRLLIVGSNPPDGIRDLSSDHIVVTGLVKNLEAFYRQSRVFVVPHQYAGGIPLKLLEAMGQGLPAVTSSVIAAQLGFTQDREVLIAATPEEFIRKIERLYTDENLWTELQKNGLSFIEKNCGPASLKARLKEIIKTAFGLKNGPGKWNERHPG